LWEYRPDFQGSFYDQFEEKTSHKTQNNKEKTRIVHEIGQSLCIIRSETAIKRHSQIKKREIKGEGHSTGWPQY
jgi:hypothetical protein